MVKTKYPKYVTTDLDYWNSADEAHFFVVKETAKPLASLLTPIIEEALESGLLREATQDEIDEYIETIDIEKRLQEQRFDSGKTYQETKDNYYKWKESYDKNNKNKKNNVDIVETTPIPDIDGIDDNVELEDKDLDKSTITTKKNKNKKPLTPQQNAINQAPSVTTKNM